MSAGRSTEPPPSPEPLSVAVADSHTHLDMQGPDVDGGIARAADVGVRTLIQVGCDLQSARWSVELASRHPNVWAAVALHPNEAPRIAAGESSTYGGAARGSAALTEALAEIDKLAGSEAVRAIGETGLDYFRTDESGVAVAQESFRAHIDMAKRHGKALAIHDRDAHDDVLRVLEEQGAPEVVVFHCFSGDAAMARYCAERGYYLSFAGTVTFKPNDQLREALAVVPLDRILVETDAPFLTPVPYRGRPNAPYLVPVTVRAMAKVREMDVDDLCAALAANTARAFDVQV